MFGHVADEQWVAQIGLIAAILQHGVGIRDARKFTCRGHSFSVRKFFENARQNRFDRLEDIFLRHEAHFEIELIEFGAAIGAQIFIAEARGDLEVTVETGNHEQLLEHLRGLRKRIEAARVKAARHEVIPCAFRARRPKDRGLEFAEPLVDHPATQRSDYAVTQHDIGVHPLAAQIHEPIFEARFFRVILRRIDDQRKIVCAALDIDRAREDFDLPRRQVLVDRHIGARFHDTVDRDDRFQLDLVKNRQRVAILVGNDLRDAVMIAEIDEENAAMVALVMHPARQTNGFADIVFVQRGTVVGTIGVHLKSFHFRSYSARGAKGCAPLAGIARANRASTAFCQGCARPVVLGRSGPWAALRPNQKRVR